VALALPLSLPLGEHRNTLLALTYCIVVVSILGQGRSIGRVVRRYSRARRTAAGRQKKASPLGARAKSGSPLLPPELESGREPIIFV
jgi:NhaP-type Na+/H+ or K+/H+ antiporter